MRGLSAFIRKEFLEQLRTYKVLIMFAVFLLFGMASPLTAKLLPDIISSLGVEGMTITFPEPTYIDAYTQFFKNTTQMGMIVLLLVFSGSIPQEVSKGTLINMLSKGLPRPAVIFAKYIAGTALWTASYAAAAAACWGYTVFLFGSFAGQNLLFSFFCLWLFGAFVLAVLMFAGTITKGHYGGLLAAVAILAVLLFLGIIPDKHMLNPMSLASVNVPLLQGTVSPAQVMNAVWTAVASVAACLGAAVLIFRKKKL